MAEYRSHCQRCSAAGGGQSCDVLFFKRAFNPITFASITSRSDSSGLN